MTRGRDMAECGRRREVPQPLGRRDTGATSTEVTGVGRSAQAKALPGQLGWAPPLLPTSAHSEGPSPPAAIALAGNTEKEEEAIGAETPKPVCVPGFGVELAPRGGDEFAVESPVVARSCKLGPVGRGPWVGRGSSSASVRAGTTQVWGLRMLAMLGRNEGPVATCAEATGFCRAQGCGFPRQVVGLGGEPSVPGVPGVPPPGLLSSTEQSVSRRVELQYVGIGSAGAAAMAMGRECRKIIAGHGL
jgi:hypothetical protein